MSHLGFLPYGRIGWNGPDKLQKESLHPEGITGFVTAKEEKDETRIYGLG